VYLSISVSSYVADHYHVPHSHPTTNSPIQLNAVLCFVSRISQLESEVFDHRPIVRTEGNDRCACGEQVMMDVCGRASQDVSTHRCDSLCSDLKPLPESVD
jgi:hypothetical protein